MKKEDTIKKNKTMVWLRAPKNQREFKQKNDSAKLAVSRCYGGTSCICDF